jgi:hypothetical protein
MTLTRRCYDVVTLSSSYVLAKLNLDTTMPKEKILIVDDEEMMRGLLAESLKD